MEHIRVLQIYMPRELDKETKDGCTYIAFRYIDGSMLIINFTEAVFKNVQDGQSFEW